MSLGDSCMGCERGAKRRRSRGLTRQTTTCSVALVAAAIAGGCGAGSHVKAVATTDAVTIVEHTAVVPPTTPGWSWAEGANLLQSVFGRPTTPTSLRQTTR